MSAAGEFDIGPLTWVKGEIEQALARAGEALAAYAANPSDAKQLKFCKTHLHQAHGALEIIGLDGVTRLTEESERLIDSLDNGTLVWSRPLRDALDGAFKALGLYLDELVDGAPHQPVRLYPAYKAVMQARGAERILESDLFFPDLTPRPPRRANTEIPADMHEYVLGQRRRFQAGLLRWLRNAADNAALREMTEAVRAIERTQAMPQHRAFWWVTIGFTETLIAVGATASIEAKRLCARIDLQMKRLMEGSQNVTERLLRDTLYFVARSRVQSQQVQEIRRVYALERAIPGEDDERRDVRPFEADLRALREIISGAKDKWNRFSSGHAHELAGFRDQAAQLKERVAALGNPDLALLTGAISAVTLWVAENPSKVTEAIALETATALLLAENAIENFAKPSPEFPRQVMAMGARLKASLAGEATDVPPPMLDEISRRAQERLVMAQVVTEIRSNLSSIESTLDGFFRDSGKRGELPALDTQIRQVSGALSMLGADRAVEALAQCRAEIARFAGVAYVPVVADFEKVAHTMSGLGFYVEALQHGPADFDALMQPVAPRRPREDHDEITAELSAVGGGFAADGGAPAPEAARTVEAELEVQRKDARALFEAWRDKPGDSMLAAEFKANLESIQQDADLVDEPGLQESAGRALELLDQKAHEGPGLADIEQAMAQVSPEPAVEALIVPSAEVSALAQASSEVVDAELLAIFLEEAREVLTNIDSCRAEVSANASDKDALTVIRRGFHTLKGSGRMVGLMRFGEAAWGAEQVMNQWLQEFRPANADLLAMIGASHALFSRWIEDLAGAGFSTADGAPLIAACERMRAGEGFALPAPAVVAAAEETAAVHAPLSAAGLERSIVIGDMRVSPSLYGIFVEEAGTHLETLQREIDLLAQEPQSPGDALVRSAHTLAGIAGTVSFRRLHELARALERALLVAKSGGIVADADDLALLHKVVDGIGALVGAVRQLQEPPPIEPLEGGLEAMRSKWLAESGEIDPQLLQIALPPVDDDVEAPPGRTEEAPVESFPTIRTRSLAVPAAEPAPAGDAHAGALTASPETMAVEAVDFDFSDVTPADASVSAMEVDMPLDMPDVALDDPRQMPASEHALPVIDLEFGEAISGSAEAIADAGTALDIDFDAEATESELPAITSASLALDVSDASTSAPTEALDLDLGDAFDVPAQALAPPLAVDDERAADLPGAAEAVAQGGAALPAQEIAAAANVDAFAAAPDDAHAQAPEIPSRAVAGDAGLVPHPGSAGFAAPDSAADAIPMASEPPIERHDAYPMFAGTPERADAPVPGIAAASTAPAVAAEPAAVDVPAALPVEPAETAQATFPGPTADAVPAAIAGAAQAEAAALSEAELRARGFDPAERLLERIEDEIDTQLLPIFLEEAAELLPQLGAQLRKWSGQPGDAGNAQALQRTLHTLKGSARMAGAMAIGQVAHSMEARMENALGLALIPATILDGLLGSYDRVSNLLEALRSGETAAAPPPVTGPQADQGGAKTPLAAPQPLYAVPLPPSVERAAGGGADDEAQRAMLRVRADLVDRLVNEAGEVAIARSRIEGELRAVKSSLKELTESVGRLRNQLREIEIAAESQMQSRQREAEEKHQAFDALEFDRFTRFQEITRMMAESVNDVATVQQTLLKNVDDADLAILAQARMNRDLQGDLMRVRMVPFNTVAERLYRVVRQTAKELSKRANLDIRGVQTEIDRSVLERMTGPFEHLLRNAIAHGLEAPAARAAAGKNEIGQIVLTARQEGNEFILIFEDDGRGLDLARIRARAVAGGLAKAGDALSDAQVAEFIFMPGFSTADEVNAISGRGIGMDVVRAEVAALGGRIDTEFTPGRGTRFTIALPLTLAVTQVVLVRTGTDLYAIPSAMVEQVRQTRAEELAGFYASQMVHWQEREYPLFYLPRLLGDGAMRAHPQRFTPLLLLRSGTQRAAIHVDELVGNQEVVVKNIGPQLARVTGIAGATVLGNGRIVLILNPVPLALAAISAGRRSSPDPDPGLTGAQARLLMPAAPTVMVVDDSLTVRKITARLLSRENYQVLTARDGVDALEQLQTARPDLLLVDIEMPRMDGFDLTRNVRADAALRHIPIIMITSRTAEKHRKYALELGVNAFLGKPYQEDELLEHIASLVNKRAVMA